MLFWYLRGLENFVIYLLLLEIKDNITKKTKEKRDLLSIILIINKANNITVI